MWDWKAHLYPIDRVTEDRDYAVYGKSVEKVIYDYYVNKD